MEALAFGSRLPSYPASRSFLTFTCWARMANVSVYLASHGSGRRMELVHCSLPQFTGEGLLNPS